VARLDEAAALTRQLKMFSYRAAPQPMQIDLLAAWNDACANVALWRATSPDALAIAVGASALVHADAQRLAVLLSILLIEVLPGTHSEAPSVRIVSEGRRTTLHVEAARHRGDHPEPGVGVTLCEEIAREMGGELGYRHDASGRLRFRLTLATYAAGNMNRRASDHRPL
jgi:C4-dicarboxylate-specific signal transduction histidine kinase